jgi:toxin-antitoxin system PIN domain toxin
VNLVAANLPLYLEASRAEDHESAREWWDAQLSGSDPAAWCWPVLNAFMRIGTDARLNRRPLTLKEANERVRSWLDATLRPPGPADRPALDHFQQMLKSGNAVGNLVSDAHLAALAVEHNCVLHSTDADFSRFRGLKWKNPVAR